MDGATEMTRPNDGSDSTEHSHEHNRYSDRLLEKGNATTGPGHAPLNAPTVGVSRGHCIRLAVAPARKEE